MQPMEMRLPCKAGDDQSGINGDLRGVRTKLLFWQQTGLALHSLPLPTPMTEIGEQVRPTNTEGSLRTTPSRPRRPEALLLSAYDHSKDFVSNVTHDLRLGNHLQILWIGSIGRVQCYSCLQWWSSSGPAQ